MSKKGWGDPDWWAKSLWKLKCPAKAKIFFWCILKKKAPTWDILQSRYKQGPGRCALCKNDLETANHLFMECPTAKKVWSEVLKQMNLTIKWEGQSLSEAWQNWWNKISEQKLRNLPPIICWGIWIARNRNIFQEKETEAVQIMIRCLSIYSIIPDAEDEREPRKVAEEQIKEGVPWAYFDGTSQENKAGAGIVINLNNTHTLKASIGLGSGSNNFAELSALKYLLCWLIHKNTLTVQIFGDSLNVINWLNGRSRCQNYVLQPLFEEIQNLKLSFNSLSINHIYRERNDMADKLSKDGIEQAVDSWRIREEANGESFVSDQPPYAENL